MKVTLSVIKADIGSIGGHIRPSRRLFETVRDRVEVEGETLLLDSYVSYTGDDIAIVMSHDRGVGAPEDLYQIATLLRDPERYVVESVWSRASGEQAVSLSTSRLHNIAGKYTGKDDPVMLVRVQKDFPATGEIIAPYATGAFVAGAMRGSHQMPLMPVELDADISYFDGPPIVSCAAFAMHRGKLTEAVDVFAHPFWDTVRAKVSDKAIEMRHQGFFGPAMLPMNELEYTGIVDGIEKLQERFTVRE